MGGNTTICSCDEDLTTDRLGESSWTAWVVSRAVGEDGELPGQIAGGAKYKTPRIFVSGDWIFDKTATRIPSK